MSIITKESIADTIEGLELLANRGIQSVHIDMAIAGMRRLLASLEAEPVGTFRKGPCGYSPSFHEDAVPLYTAPPAPVSVPDLKVLDEFIFNLVYAMASEELSHNEKELFSIASKYISYARERFSAAMLQGAENAESTTTIQTAPDLDSLPKIAESPSGNSPVIPDGWKLVPVEPTMSQELAGYRTLTDTGKMSRLMKTRLSNIYRAMIAAAPQQEVK